MKVFFTVDHPSRHPGIGVEKPKTRTERLQRGRIDNKYNASRRPAWDPAACPTLRRGLDALSRFMLGLRDRAYQGHCGTHSGLLQFRKSLPLRAHELENNWKMIPPLRRAAPWMCSRVRLSGWNVSIHGPPRRSAHPATRCPHFITRTLRPTEQVTSLRPITAACSYVDRGSDL